MKRYFVGGNSNVPCETDIVISPTTGKNMADTLLVIETANRGDYNEVYSAVSMISVPYRQGAIEVKEISHSDRNSTAKCTYSISSNNKLQITPTNSFQTKVLIIQVNT